MTVMSVVEHHNGTIAKVSPGGTSGWITLHLAFRNVADKQAFNYAMTTAWPNIVRVNRPGTVNVDVIVPLQDSYTVVSGVQVHPSAFSGVYNLANEHGEGFGHVQRRTDDDDWTAWLWETGHDEYQGTFGTLGAAIQAMSVLAP